jgi:hypothetical protein
MGRRAEVSECAHPELSKPSGWDWSKSGREGRFGPAVRVGRGFAAGRGDGVGWTARAGSGVAAGAAGALIAAAEAAGAGGAVARARFDCVCFAWRPVAW